LEASYSLVQRFRIGFLMQIDNSLIPLAISYVVFSVEDFGFL